MSLPPSGQWPTPGQGPVTPWGPPPPRRSKKTTWILTGLAFTVVVVLTVVATLLVTRQSPPSASTAPSGSTDLSADSSNVASANDRGPVEIITEEPTCDSWFGINDVLTAEAAKGWAERNSAIPLSQWTPAVREVFAGMADVMRTAASQTIALSRLTPHRVVRELYSQSAAYWRAYADSISSYAPEDNSLAEVSVGTANALVWLCSAIKFGSAAARAPLIDLSSASPKIAPVENLGTPQRFMTRPVKVCSQWLDAFENFHANTIRWAQSDPNLPANQWSSQQQTIYTDVAPVMTSNANTLQMLGIQSGNQVFDDFASLAAQYRRGFVRSFDTYQPADAYLANAAAELTSVNYAACKFAGA